MQQCRTNRGCLFCRSRNTQCVISDNQTICDMCRRHDRQCVMQQIDSPQIKRAHPQVSSTNGADGGIHFLDVPLTNSTAHISQATHSMDHSGPTQLSQQSQPTFGRRINGAGEVPSSVLNKGNLDLRPPPKLPAAGSADDSTKRPSDSTVPKHTNLIQRLLSDSGHLSYDSTSGRTRYFGPTTNFHVYSSDLGLRSGLSAAARDQDMQADRIVRNLPVQVHDYLMDLFWTYYNSVLHVVHKEAFYKDKENCRTQYYSGFLHLCLLAMGYRFADHDRPGIESISLGKRESLLYRGVKWLCNFEVEEPKGLTTVQAMLILGDLECGAGKDNIGWVYGGLACRLAFDIGLHIDCTPLGLAKDDQIIRGMVLWACVIYDKYWALFLGRPTTIKTSDLVISGLADSLSQLSTYGPPAGPDKCYETEIYEALLDLMDIATQITGRMDERPDPRGSGGRLLMATLDSKLNTWYNKLPAQLRWHPENIENGPFSFFLFHQQFHCALILLHRPFAWSGSVPETGPEIAADETSFDHAATVSRMICFNNAIRVAQIFSCHRHKFPPHKIFVTGLQHAGTAATALVAVLAAMDKDAAGRPGLLKHLRILTEALEAMAPAYQPAERMSDVLNEVLRESGWELEAERAVVEQQNNMDGLGDGLGNRPSPNAMFGDGDLLLQDSRRFFGTVQEPELGMDELQCMYEDMVRSP